MRVATDEEHNILLQVAQGTVYVNRREIEQQSQILQSGDEVEVYGAKILFLNQLIVVFAYNNVLSINPQTSGLIPTDITNKDNIKNIEVKDKNLYEEEDYFSKSPRLRRIVEEKEIELTQPPQPEKRNDLPLILTIGPMLAMGISSVVMVSNSVSQLASGLVDLKDTFGPLLVSVTMLMSTLLWPILTKRYNKRQQEKNNKIKFEKYQKYLVEKKEELENESKLQKEIIKENVISVNQCLENLKHRKLNFWDKRMDQNDFLVARLGIGDEKLKVKINYPEKGFSIEEDELKKQVDQMVTKYKYIKDVPIGYSFYENNITAVMGESNRSHHFLNNILLQLLTFYSYDDLKIVVFTNERNISYWNYIKYLNHNMTNDSAFRFFASNEDSATTVIDVLKQEVENRVSQLGNNNQAHLFKPYYFVIVDDIDIVKKTNFLESITELKTNIGFSVVILESKLSKLPSLCNNFINIGEKTSGVLKNSYEKQEQILFENEINPNINMMDVAKILANIPIEIASNGEEDQNNLPDSITFLEMAKVGKVEQLNILNRWNTNDSTSNLKAEVGVSPDGKLMYLDLHEKAHGPHGLIAGMTGSGKSEFIITWILSLCMNFSPEDVAFILLDYKGGGLAFAFENQVTGVRLPHLTGTITNLDKAEINRTLVSIDSEVKRRQRIFNEARDKLGESTIDIYKYQGFYHDGKLEEPLPHLFIVCDEFAELKAQQPDFMDNLISVARIGRSLGVHLILATQKPSGVVNDKIWSNTKFRVCLKVQDASDSNEMLKRPDAASLKQTGRFYLQVGYDEYFALGQSGWCGAKYYPSDILVKSVDKSVNVIDETGITIKNIQSGTSNVKKAEAEGEQLAAIMKEIIKVATESNRFAKRLWLENIPEIITIDGTEKKYNFTHQKDDFSIVIGEYDAPENQDQKPLIYNLLDDGNASIVGTDSQESEAIINNVLYNIMKNFSSTEVTFYIIDYGSQNMLKYNKAAHCGGVVAPGDAEQFSNLIKLISEEQRARKKTLSDFGGEYKDYIKEHPNEMAIMLVVFNNYESIYESNQTLYDILGELLRDSERYGIVYMFTSSTISAIADRFRQLISFYLAMKLKDPLDYSSCFNVRDRIEPRNIFGRGICKNEKLHEFQTAFICEERINENKEIIALIDEINQKGLPKAKKIPSLPDQVLLSDVESKLKGLERIPVGIEKGVLTIRTFNMTAEVGKVVISPKIKYTKFFINSFIDELIHEKINVVVIDARNLIPETAQKVNHYIIKDYDAELDKLIETAEQTKDDIENKTVVIIYSISKLMDRLEESSKIGNLFNTYKTTGNSYILIVDETTKLKEYAYEDWFRNIDTSEGVYIGRGAEEQNILRISNYGRELSQPMPKNYGVYIAEGLYYIIKLIEFERIEDDEDDED